MAGDGSRCRSTHYACACTLHRLAAADALARAVEEMVEAQRPYRTAGEITAEQKERYWRAWDGAEAALSAYRRTGGGQ